MLESIEFLKSGLSRLALRPMKIISPLLLLAALAALWAGCGDPTGCRTVPEAAPVPLVWESLSTQLPAVKTKADLVNFFTAHPDVRDVFFQRTQYPSDSAFINELYQRFTNPHIDTLLMETQRIFGDEQQLKKEFEAAFGRLRSVYPDWPLPKIKTVITGLENDLFVSDSLIIVGLDYYLGEDARYKPNMFEYMLRRYHPGFIVPSVMLLLGVDNRINQTNVEDRTVIADMVSYGKAYYFAQQMLPCVADSTLFGYTPRELEGSKRFEDLIWKRMVEDNILFSTSYIIKQKYIQERPKTAEVGPECPGRIGTWVGLRIVEAYMAQKPETTLPQLMQLPDAGALFKTSKYRPG